MIFAALDPHFCFHPSAFSLSYNPCTTVRDFVATKYLSASAPPLPFPLADSPPRSYRRPVKQAHHHLSDDPASFGRIILFCQEKQ